MNRSWVCEQGHTWQTSGTHGVAIVCPYCGSGVNGNVSSCEGISFVDELPPPPQSEMKRANDHATLRIADDVPAGTIASDRIGDYELLTELGRGGMGIVYRARQLRLGRVVALKMILAAEYADPELLKRFRQEAATVARLQHPNIVQIHEVGEQGGRTFFSFEYVDGGSLAQKLASGPLPQMSAAELVRTLALATQYAHERSVIHRDLKPANVLLTADGTPKIADFGLARLIDDDQGQTRSGAMLGTAGYMAPEQARGEIRKIGPATDVYLLGAVLYESLTSRPPFRGATAWETIQQSLTEEPLPLTRLQPGLPRDLETICLKCLQKDPSRRYATAAALADDLGRFLRGEPVRARPASAVERGLKWVKRRPAVAAVWMISIVAAIALAVTLVIANFRLQRERDSAQASSDAAMEAVNRHFTLISENALLNSPHMESVRRQLLHEAKEHYEKFVANRSGDPRLRAELGRCYARLGKITLQTGSKNEAKAHYLQSIATLDAVLQEKDDAAHRFALASAWNELGAVYVSMRELETAANAYQSAVQLAKSLLQDQAESADYMQLRGQALHGLGEVHRVSGKAEQAEMRFREALAAHQAAANVKPHHAAYQRDLAHTQHNLGVVAQMAGDWAKAEKEYKEALAVRERLAQVHPNVPPFQSAVAASLVNLGWLYYATDRMVEAESPWNRVVEIQEKLALTFPDVVTYQVELAEAYSNSGSLNLATKNWDAARKGYAESLRIRRLLVERFPRDPEHRDGLAQTHNNLGALAGNTGDLVRAETEFSEAAKIRENLAQEQPAVVKYRFDFGTNCTNLAKLKQSQGDNEGAQAWFDRGIKALDQVMVTEPSNVQARTNLIATLSGRAETRLALHRADAISDWARAAELEDASKRDQWLVRRTHSMARLGKRADAYREAQILAKVDKLAPESCYFLACTYSLLSAEAASEPGAPSNELCTVSAVEMLKRAQAGGYFDDAAVREHLESDPDLQALREHVDFKKWLASLIKD